MGDLGYVYEKFSHPSHALAERSRSLAERLIRAYGDYVVHALPPGPSVPAPLANRIANLDVLMTQRPDPAEIGTLAATVHLMTTVEQEAVEREITNIAIERAKPSSARGRRRITSPTDQ